jgi:hypothetical protein
MTPRRGRQPRLPCRVSAPTRIWPSRRSHDSARSTRTPGQFYGRRSAPSVTAMVADTDVMVAMPSGVAQSVRVEERISRAGDCGVRSRRRRGLTPTEFAAYAADQVACGRRQLTEHVADGTGCCRICGRPSPCPAACEGAALVQHFHQWLPESSLVRPYVNRSESHAR